MDTPLLAIIFLLASAMLSGMRSALQHLGRVKAKKVFEKYSRLFFFQALLKPLFKERAWEGLHLTLSLSKNALRLFFAFSAFTYLEHVTSYLISGSLVVIAISILLDFLMQLSASARPLFFFKCAATLTSIILLIFCPISALFMKISHRFFSSKKSQRAGSIRDKILEILYESDLEPSDQKLILSLASFKERIVREVMVPRIEVFTLPKETTIEEAAQSFLKEEYSRIPVYRDTVDHIVGVLLYKDVLTIYAKYSGQTEKLQAPIETLIKPVLHTPETKKISQLLQEFRNKHLHLAIVVDEYGGTEGIITIEDILEELVGEIADEYDTSEERLYSSIPTGGWIVDAKMTITDIEEELGVQIPSSPEYDTLGGYVFHKAGAIPSKGWRIHHDDFDLEVLSSDERSIEKVRITPHQEKL